MLRVLTLRDLGSHRRERGVLQGCHRVGGTSTATLTCVWGLKTALLQLRKVPLLEREASRAGECVKNVPRAAESGVCARTFLAQLGWRGTDRLSPGPPRVSRQLGGLGRR